MEIHGSDIILKNVKISITEDFIVPIIKEEWPDAVYEKEEDKQGLHLFVYKNTNAEEAWNAEGWSEGNDEDMIYVIWEPRIQVLTCVIDDCKHNKFIVDKIEKLINV